MFGAPKACTPRAPWVPLMCVCLGAWACREPAQEIEIPPLTRPSDAGVLIDGAAPPPPGALPCDTPADCDDGIACTVERCAPPGYCQWRVGSELCDDGVYCNGIEVCDVLLGCQAPLRARDCDDGDVCTTDACDEGRARCVHVPRDLDGDGDPDEHCGGADCDDLDGRAASGLPELCADDRDNDCDGAIDETECGATVNDTCADALALTSSQVARGEPVRVSLSGAVGDYELSCDPASTREVALSFELEAASDVEVSAAGVLANGARETATVSLRAERCGQPALRDCDQGFPASLRLRALPAGRYFLLVDSPDAPSAVVSVRASAVTEAPTHLDCDTAKPIVGERFIDLGDFVDVSDALVTACDDPDQPVSRPDLVYTYTLTEERDVSLLLSSPAGEIVSLSVRDTCEEPASTRTCRLGAPALARLHRQPPGDYFVVVESPSFREVDFAFEAVFEPPTDAPAGDECATAEPLPLETTVFGNLAGKQPSVSASCHDDFIGPDAVYRLEVDARADVTLRADSEDGPMRMAVQSTCGERQGELRCQRGEPSQVTLWDLAPGTYYVAVDSTGATEFSLRASADSPTTPTSVSDNEECADAADIPESGGLFTGTTAGMFDDYAGCFDASEPDAVYRLALSRESLVTARLSADFDTVLYRFASVCGGAIGECDDDDGEGTQDSALIARLPEGDHYFVVDGRNGGQGPYWLEVTVE